MKTGKNLIGDLSDGIQSAMEKAQEKFRLISTENNKSPNCGNDIFCSNCGMKLSEKAKFCSDCGAAIGEKTFGQQNPPPIPLESNNITRQQQYVGKILKCPNCGNPLSETMVTCPSCGMQITGRTAVSSVRLFNEQLMEIEKHKTKTIAGMLGLPTSAVSQTDREKLTLIRTFPIPNTIDDILEFVMLAIANIDVNLSKKLRTAREDLASEMPKAISNAWVLKLQQAYQKAEIMFPDNPIFLKIQKNYFDKMKELKIKI